MEANAVGTGRESEFGSFLRQFRWQIIAILLLSGGLRLFFWWVLAIEPVRGDGFLRYVPTALNILAGNGFSLSASEPYLPSEAANPLYPLFIAGIYWIFGNNPAAVVTAHIIIDLLTGLLVAFVAFNLAPVRLKQYSALAALTTYGLLAWICFVWIFHLFTETLVIFLMMLMVCLVVQALKRLPEKTWLWFAVGAVCGLTILTRSDMVLLAIAASVFLLITAFRLRSKRFLLAILSFGLAIVFTLAPWTIRNYLAFGKFQPLHSEWGFAQEGYMPTGYLYWIETWILDETYFQDIYNQAFTPGQVRFDTELLPTEVFDSREEQERIKALMRQYNETLYFTPEIDEEFRRIADERVNRSPLRFYAWLPLKRTVSLWLTGFSTRHAHNGVLILRILSVLPIIFLGFLGFVVSFRQHLVILLLAIILSRTIFLAYHYAPETRYIVEAYPPMIAACGVGAAALFQYISRRFEKLKGSQISCI